MAKKSIYPKGMQEEYNKFMYKSKTGKNPPKKETPATKVFNQLITLYDVADELHNDGKPDEADTIRKTLDGVGKFILSIK